MRKFVTDKEQLAYELGLLDGINQCTKQLDKVLNKLGQN